MGGELTLTLTLTLARTLALTLALALALTLTLTPSPTLTLTLTPTLTPTLIPTPTPTRWAASIVLWVLFNEAWGQHAVAASLAALRSLDKGRRLITDVSGWSLSSHDVPPRLQPAGGGRERGATFWIDGRTRRCGGPRHDCGDTIDVHAYPGPWPKPWHRQRWYGHGWWDALQVQPAACSPVHNLKLQPRAPRLQPFALSPPVAPCLQPAAPCLITAALITAALITAVRAARPSQWGKNAARASVLGEFGGVSHRVEGHTHGTDGWGYQKAQGCADFVEAR